MVEIPSKISKWNDNIWIVENESMIKIGKSKKRLNIFNFF